MGKMQVMQIIGICHRTDDQVSTSEGLLTGITDGHLEGTTPSLSSQALDVCLTSAEESHFLKREQLTERLEVAACLDTTADERCNLGILAGHPLGSGGTEPRRPHLGYPVAIKNRDRQSATAVEHRHKAVDLRQTPLRIARVEDNRLDREQRWIVCCSQRCHHVPTIVCEKCCLGGAPGSLRIESAQETFDAFDHLASGDSKTRQAILGEVWDCLVGVHSPLPTIAAVHNESISSNLPAQPSTNNRWLTTAYAIQEGVI
jgi:hypothetical protein